MTFNTNDWIFLLTIPLYLRSIHLILSAQGRKTEISLLFYISYTIFAFFLVVVEVFTDISIYGILVNAIFIYWITRFYQSDVLERVANTSLTVAFLLGVDIACSSLIHQQFASFEYNSLNNVFDIIISRTILLMSAFLVYSFLSSKKRHFHLSSSYYLGYSVIICGIIYLYFDSITKTGTSELKLLFSSIILLMVVFFIFYIDEKLQTSFQFYNENAILKEQSISFENQKELINQSLYHSNSLKHDMKNQVLVLLSLLEKGDVEEIQLHSQRMLQEIDGTKTLARSGHFVLDSLINHKLVDCSTMKILLDLQISQDLPILAYDLTIILGNLLDNAVTAVKSSTNEPYININVESDRGNLLILIENSFDGKVHIENGEYFSTKPFCVNHGYGLKNVENAVERYNGFLELEHGSQIFTARVLIPLAEIGKKTNN